MNNGEIDAFLTNFAPELIVMKVIQKLIATKRKYQFRKN